MTRCDLALEALLPLAQLKTRCDPAGQSPHERGRTETPQGRQAVTVDRGCAVGRWEPPQAALKMEKSREPMGGWEASPTLPSLAPLCASRGLSLTGVTFTVLVSCSATLGCRCPALRRFTSPSHSLPALPRASQDTLSL